MDIFITVPAYVLFFMLLWNQFFNLCIYFSFPFSTVLPTYEVTPAESSKTWGRSSVLPKEEGEEEEKRGQKKKGRTWGPSSLCHKELGAGEDG